MLPKTISIRHVTQRLPGDDVTPAKPGVVFYTEADSRGTLSEALKLLKNLVLIEEPPLLQAHLDAGLYRKLVQLAAHKEQSVRFAAAYCMATTCVQLGVEPETLFAGELG